MLRFMDGFDHYAPVDTKGAVLQKYLSAAGYTIRNANDDTFSIVNGRRSGMCALRFSAKQGATVNASLSWGFRSTSQLVVFGFALQAGGTRMRICRIDNVIDLNWDRTTGKLSIDGQLGETPLIMNAWYYFEIEIDRTKNQVRVWANDSLQLTVPLTPVIPDRWVITWGQDGQVDVTGTQDIDDMYVVDSSPGKRIERLKPCEVTTRMPTADVTAEWSIVNGGAIKEHYQIAGQKLAMEPGAPYLQSNINGQRDIYRSNAVLPTDNVIHGVAVATLARKGDLDDRSIGVSLSAGGQDKEVAIKLTENYAYYQVTYEQTPADTDWTRNTVESSEFGITTR